MAWQLYTYENMYYDDANFLDSQTELSFFLRARIDTLYALNSQVVLSHRGAGNEWYVRKRGTAPEQMQFRVITGGYYATAADTGWTPIAGEIHSWGGRWKKDTAVNGITIVRDGATGYEATTAGQTVTYDSGGSVDLYLGAYTYNNSPWRGSIEDVMIWTGYSLTTAQIARLHAGYRWFEIVGLPRPAVWYPLNGGLIGRAPDLSGNNRHIEQATIEHYDLDVDGGVFAVNRPPPTIGWSPSLPYRPVPAGTPSPNAWEFVGETVHPTVTKTVDGLTNGTAYEFTVTAVDSSGNESGYAPLIELTPSVPAPSVVTHPVPWKQPKRRSKYRSTQQ